MTRKRLCVGLAVLGTAGLWIGCIVNPLASDRASLFPIAQNGKNGYINSAGEIVIQPQFEFTLPFSEGLAAVCMSGRKCGYIDPMGKYAINPQFAFASRFSDGLAAVVTEDRIGFIDRSGSFVINPQFETVGMGPGLMGSYSTFSEGYARVMTGGKFGFIDKTGKFQINPQFDDAYPFLDGLAAVRMGDRWGYIGTDGKVVINPQFDDAQPFVQGLAAVKVGSLYGYIDKTGKVEINPQFTYALPFSSDGLAGVLLNEKLGFIGTDGKYVVNPQFAHRPAGPHSTLELVFAVTPELGRISFSEGLSPVKVGEKFGFIDTTGKIVINPQFDDAFPFYNGLAAVSMNNSGPGGISWIDKTGSAVWRPAPRAPSNVNVASNAVNAVANQATAAANAAAAQANSFSNSAAQNLRTGRLTTDSNIRNEPNKDASSLGIHFKGARVEVLAETSYTRDDGLSTWYRIRVKDYGCSVNANLGCGKNNSNDADEGWVNARNVLLD